MDELKAMVDERFDDGRAIETKVRQLMGLPPLSESGDLILRVVFFA